MLVRSEKIKTGAIYAVYLEQNWIFSGGWDKTVNIQVPFIFVCCYFHVSFTFGFCFPLVVL